MGVISFCTLAFSFESMSIKIQDVIELLERKLPLKLQESWDNSGLQVGSTSSLCTGVLLCLDVTEAIIGEAKAKGCNLIVAHHPLLFRGLKCIGDKSYVERSVALAIKHDISIYAAHTNADTAPEGLNYLLGQKLGLEHISILDPNPSGESGLGVIGELKESMALSSFIAHLANIFDSKQVRRSPYTPQSVKRVALCGGAGAFLHSRARAFGADVFITGEAKYNDYFDAEGICLITIGHYESEYIACQLFEQIISTEYPKLCQLSEINVNPVISE